MKQSILHVHTVPVISGSGINTLLTMRASRERGHDVALACARAGPLTEEAERHGIDIYPIPEMDREVDPVRDVASVSKLMRLMKTRAFTLVHTHNSKAGFVGRLAAKLAGVRVTIHTVHGFSFHENESRLRRRLFLRLERLAGRWCDGMIFISKPLVEWAHREKIGLRVPMTLIYSGINDREFRNARGNTVRKDLGIRSGRIVVGMISKLWEGKGHDVLLRAWQRIMEANAGARQPPLLLIVGEGPLESSLREQVHRMGLERTVTFTGFRSDIPEVTACLDIAVLPSMFEGMGRVVLEAMAAAKPVIASRVGGIPDLIVDGFTGLLFEPGDDGALADRLSNLVSNPEARNRLARNGWQSFKPEFSSTVMVEKIHDFYNEVLRMRMLLS